MTLVEFLRARLDEDEQAARASDPGPWEVGSHFGAKDSRVYVREQGDLIDSVGTCVIAGQVANKTRFRENAIHIARHDPARVLREVEATRRIIAEHKLVPGDPRSPDGPDYGCETCHDHSEYGVGGFGYCTTLRLLALSYAGHPDYREEWKP